MPRIVLAAALAWAFVSPAAAAQILYATAAVADRVEGFCLGPNGGMETLPAIQKDTVENPRRLLVAGDALYVAGRHKVESFQIKMNGGLESTGVTPQIHNANPYDIAVDAARTHIYVPDRSSGRIKAFPLDPVTGGILGGSVTSCALVRNDVNLQDLEVGIAAVMGVPTEVLYVTEATSPYVGGKKGRVDVFQLTNGELPDLYDDPEGAARCANPNTTTTTSTTSSTSTSLTTLTTTVTTTSTSTTVDTRFTEPLSTRKKLRNPGPFVLSGQFLYVYDARARKIIEFELVDGLFTDDEQPRVTATNEVGRFLDLIGFDGTVGGSACSPTAEACTLFGAADSQGRVRAFALKTDDDGQLVTKVPKSPQRQTDKIIETTPVRITVGAADATHFVLYVPGGEANRLHAYRVVEKVDNDGRLRLFPEAKSFSKTEKRRATFPNDAVVAQIPGTCP